MGKRTEYMRKWREGHRDHLRAYNYEYHYSVRPKRLEQMKAWKKANPEMVLENTRKWRRENPERARELTRKWQNNHPEWVKNNGLKKHGITLAEYNEMLKKQGGVCAICKKPQPKHWRFKHLAVDHCHGTGRIRGLLCHVCNLVIGQFEDNPQRLRDAAAYLETA